MTEPTRTAPVPATQAYAERRTAFRALHASGFFVLPNPWDAGSARYLQQAGFAALATTSSGAAFSRAASDGAMTLDETLAHIADIVAATTLPVNADFEDGHGADAEAVAANVRRCVDTGVAGVSIEDATGDASRPLYDFAEATDRIRAARSAIDASGADVMLVGRAECWLTGHATPLAEATRRLVAYAEAGADCLYAPGVTKLDEIEALVRAVAPKPVNVLLRPSAGFPSMAALEQAGVRRVSVGGALAIAAWEGFALGVQRLQRGEGLVATSLASYASLNNMFGSR